MTRKLFNVIDGHFHIWDVCDKTFDKTILEKDGLSLYTFKDYETEWNNLSQNTKAFKFFGAVYVETISVQFPQKSPKDLNLCCLAEYQYVRSQLEQSHYEYRYVFSAALEDDDTVDHVLAIYKNDERVRGIRQILNKNPSWPRNDVTGDLMENAIWVKNLQRLHEFDLSFEFQLNPWQYNGASQIIEASSPNMVFIINHLGTPLIDDLTNEDKITLYWNGLKGLSKFTNVFMKLSMFCYIDKDWEKNTIVVESIVKVIELFGVNRLGGIELCIKQK
eukprot:Awhi_evm2s11293